MDKETIQILLDLLNPLHGSLDRQTYDARIAACYDMPPDYEFEDVMITSQQERDLTQAICILESRLREVDVSALSSAQMAQAADEAKKAAERVASDSRVDPKLKQIPMGPAVTATHEA